MACNIKNIFYALVYVVFVSSVFADPEHPTTFEPSEYDLTINTKQEHFQDATTELTYSGKVVINFERKGKEPGPDFNITLNINKDTKITKVTLEGVSGSKETNVLNEWKKIEDKLVLFVKKDLVEVTEFKVTVDFTNPFGKDMSGFYRSSYNEGNNTRWLLTTHFEPIYARDAFPCFDEPHLKAKFKITIFVPNTITTVLSNTKGSCTFSKTEGDLNKCTFDETPAPMSTYLVAFTASNFKSTEADKFGDEKELKTYGRSEIIDKGDGALAQVTAKEAVNKLADYLNEPYTFDKIDQVGIPDFSAGAMENWGHISFREKALFYNKSSSSLNTKQSNVLTITHELVHQWFGNLVTLHSWDFIWLNEAFANYLEYGIASQIEAYKNWKLMEQLVVNEIHLRAFETDGLPSSKPLNCEIHNESHIVSHFGDIPYSKGAAVLRMWHAVLGEEKFRDSLREYIKDRKEKTATPDQLFQYFKKNGLKEEDFKTWTDQAGYPVVEFVKVKPDIYNLVQRRFFWEKPSKEENIIWSIPITFSTDKCNNFSVTPKLWLYNESFPRNKTWKWIVANNHQTGYFRVNYDKENWIALSKALLEENHSGIPELNRAQILNDALSLARSVQKDYLDYGTALNLTKYLDKEESLVAWKTALHSFEFLKIKLHKTGKTYNKFKEHVLSLIKPHFKGLNKTDLSHVETLKNVEISRWACSLEWDVCVKQAKDLFNTSSHEQYPDTKEIVLCTVVRNDENAWKSTFEKYKKERDSSVKLMYLSALGCSSSKKIIDEYLDKTLRNDSDVRKQDLIYVLQSVYNGNLDNVDTALKFIQKNYEKIAEKYGGLDPLGRALVGVAKKIKTQDQLKIMEELAKKIKASGNTNKSSDSADNAVNIAKSNVNWVKQRMDQVETYLNSGSLFSCSLALLLVSVISVFQLK